MKDKYTPVPDTPVLIRAKRAYLNASDVSTPATAPAASPCILQERTGRVRGEQTCRAQNISVSPIKEFPLFTCPLPFEIRNIIKF